MISPDTGSRADVSHPLIAAQALANRVGHVPAAAAGSRNSVELLDQVFGQQEVRAHTHAHMIAHNREFCNGGGLTTAAGCA